MKKVLFISNGHGEDAMAVRIIHSIYALRPSGVTVHGWPTVGQGDAYKSIGVPVVGEPNLLPSQGFTLKSWKSLRKDFPHGIVATHARQILAAKRLGSEYDLAVAVGDEIPVIACLLAQIPFFFVGCYKSSLYGLSMRYHWLDTYWLRNHALHTFPRDRATANTLRRARVPNTYVGIPCMDGLDPIGLDFGLLPESWVVGLLPGSRDDSVDNALDLAHCLIDMQSLLDHSPLAGLMPVTKTFDHAFLARTLENKTKGEKWIVQEPESNNRTIACELQHPGGVRLLIIKGGFADALHQSQVVLGLAGTANEQAVGLGKPLVTFPSRGVTDKKFVDMKMALFRDAAVAVSRAQAGATAASLLKNPGQRQHMALAGKAAMGKPGASKAIARYILGYLGH